MQTQLALVVGEPTFRLWLVQLQAVELHDGHLVIEAPAQARQWIQARFGRVIQASVELVLGPDSTVEIRGPQDTAGQPAGAVRGASPAARRARPDAPIPHPHDGPLGNPKLSFDQFVIGDSNRLAHAAALTVAEMPAQAYNPLFICGPPGVGKTHLLSSIANLLMTHNPELTVRATTGEAFTNEFLGALGDRSTESFKSRFRDIDVLLVDDVQFLERKTRTEEEFFHTFNALHDGGRQVVLTSDRPPHDLQALEDRLRERFEAGLIADIRPPDLATRLAILRKRAHHDGVSLADERVLNTIAEHVQSNVRALEGALIRVVAFSSLTGRELTCELAREVLASLYPQPVTPGRRERTIAEIQTATCAHFELSADELVSPGRSSTHRVATAGRDVPGPRADGSLPACDRTRVRRTRPHHRAPRLQARLGPTGLR